MNILLFLIGFLLLSTGGWAQRADYLPYVKTHCDNLIQHGQDRYGTKKTAMLASVIDIRDLSVPQADVPPTAGTRAHDRAVGGSNFYHDVETIRLFRALSAHTEDQQYEDAAFAYARDFLGHCQNPSTGLLAWGEHLYYNFFADSVMVGELAHPRADNYHEFLEETPPWPLLWEVDSAVTERAIAGVRYHFRSPTTQTFLFNRHAYWHPVDQQEYRGLAQYQDGGQPWIKHSGLQCYSFTFLYEQTQEPEWRRWAEGTGSLYWNYRDPTTNLTVSCLDDPRDNARHASLNQTGLLSYYLLKSWQVHPAFGQFRERAETMLKAAEKFSWSEDQKGYYRNLHLDGSPVDDELVPVVYTGYGGADILAFGRIACYFYQTTGDPAYRTMVQRAASMLLATSWPDDFVVNSLGGALQFSLDAYEVLADERLLRAAHDYAAIGIERLWSGQLFVRQPGDPFYEAKLGTNAFVAGLFRLHLLENGQTDAAGLRHWSF